MISSERGVPTHIWDDYDPETKGKIMAANIVGSRLQTIERFYRELDSAKSRSKPKKG